MKTTNLILHQEPMTVTYRNESFTYMYLSYEDTNTGERFTTTKLDEVNVAQVYNQYRVKYGIPFPDEIKSIREKYGLSAAAMSDILGLGPNQYRLYEGGDMPSETNGKLLASIRNTNTFMMYIENVQNQYTSTEFERLKIKIEKAIAKYPTEANGRQVFQGYLRGTNNGFAVQSVTRLHNLLLYIIEHCQHAYQTKVNKLLFYIDFLAYKHTGYAISGLTYNAIQYGPVPSRWDRVYSAFDDILPQEENFANGGSGISLIATTSADMSSFSEDEIHIIDTVLHQLCNKTSSQLTAMSHEEDAWKKYVDTNEPINFQEAFSLKAVSL